MATYPAKKAIRKRKELREEHWPGKPAWEGPSDQGWFCGPRTLPFVVLALSDKKVSGKMNPAKVYLDLLSCHRGQGIVELKNEEDHTYAAGLRSTKAWRQRMAVLVKAGFIEATGTGIRRYAKVFLIHPAVAMAKLRQEGKVDDMLWEAYRNRAIDDREPSAEDVLAREGADSGSGVNSGGQ